MKLSELEKQKRLDALRELLAEEEEKKPEDDEKEKIEDDGDEENGEEEEMKNEEDYEEDDEEEKMKNEEDYEEDDEEEKIEDNGDEENSEKMKESYLEHLNVMFKGTKLTNESKQKIKILFEAAVKYEVDKRISSIKRKLEKEMNEALKQKEEELKNNVNDYLSYVVEEWAAKNKVALKQQIKMNIMENFISGLRNLFLEHNINIPDSKISLVDELMERISSLEEDIKTLSRKNIRISEELDKAKREIYFKDISEGMTELEIEKFKKLVNLKHYETAEKYKESLKLIKESYFNNNKKQVEILDEEKVSENETDVPENIKEYVNLLTKIAKSKF